MPLASRKEMEARYGQMVAEKQRLDQQVAQAAAQTTPGQFVSGLGTGLMDQLRGWRDIAKMGGQYAQNYINDIVNMRDPNRNLPGYTEIAKLGEAVANPQTYVDIGRNLYQQATESPESLGRLVGQNVNPLRVLNAKPVMSEINVYHGSPHKFEAFDASKIGTGEGAQAYGHGIYLAENPGVAKSYQFKRLTGDIHFNDGTKINVLNLPKNSPEKIAAQTWLTNPNLKDAEAFVNSIDEKEWPAPRRQIILELKKLHEKGADLGGGNLYTADLPDPMVERMLDWDKPLSEQSPNVLAALKKSKNKQIRAMLEYAKTPYTGAGIEGETKTMGEAYRAMSMNLSGRANAESAKASKLLQQAGIPGIRYLDAGSRGQGGTGTRNFVVFPGEETKVKILKRE